VINPSIAAITERLKGSVAVVDTKTFAMGGSGGDEHLTPEAITK